MEAFKIINTIVVQQIQKSKSTQKKKKKKPYTFFVIHTCKLNPLSLFYGFMKQSDVFSSGKETLFPNELFLQLA